MYCVRILVVQLMLKRHEAELCIDGTTWATSLIIRPRMHVEFCYCGILMRIIFNTILGYSFRLRVSEYGMD